MKWYNRLPSAQQDSLLAARFLLPFKWQAQTGGPYCYYPPGWDRVKLPVISTLAKPIHQRIAYWDESDRIPAPILVAALSIAVQTNHTIVVGIHRDLNYAARWLRLSITTITIPSFDVIALTQWVNKRISAVRLPGEFCGLALEDTKAEKIAIIANGSWREASDLLHIWAAEQALRVQQKRYERFLDAG